MSGIRPQSSFLAIVLCCFTAAMADDWPQWRGPGRDGVWSEDGIIERFETERLEPLWRARISSGYCSPTVARGRVYVADRLTEPTELERVQCFDAENGRKIWSYSYECSYRKISYRAGPRASITINDGRAYALGTMGHLHCFDAATGKVLWKKDLSAEYDIRMPVWGIAAAPLIEGDILILQIGGSDGACVLGLNKTTGAEIWRALDDHASYSAPIVIDQANKRVLVCWTGRRVAGMDPATGKIYWDHEFTPTRMVISIATPVVEDGYLLVSSFYDGSLVLKLDPNRLAAEKLWRRHGRNEKSTDSLHCCISTPIIQDDCIYGVDSYGQLRCLDLETGDRIWMSMNAVPHARWSNIHMVRQKDRVWMFNERGELIIGRLSPEGFTQISRTRLIDPTTGQLKQRNGVCWSHPAFADRHVFIRNDEELICADLSAAD